MNDPGVGVETGSDEGAENVTGVVGVVVSRVSGRHATKDCVWRRSLAVQC